MNSLKLYYQVAKSASVVKRAFKVAFVVGSVLNIINQGEVLFRLDLASLNYMKIFLTYIVPYSVTTYTAIAFKLEFHIGSKAVVDAHLQCRGCKSKIYVKEGELIPECGSCGISTQWKLI